MGSVHLLDPHRGSGGTVKFKDIIDGLTVHEEVDEVTGLSRRIIVDSPDEKKQPTLEITGKDGQGAARVPHAVARAHDGGTTAKRCSPGDVLAKIPRETTKTKDITGGLPRVVELFEARKPRDTAAVIGNRRHRADAAASSRACARSSSFRTSGAEPREYSPAARRARQRAGRRARRARASG